MIDSRDAPPVFVVLCVGPVPPERLAQAGYRPMARAAHPGLASLAATLATGCWPERHGVVRGIEPHPDRLSFTKSRPENRGVPAAWSAAVRAGRRAAVVGWPHDTAELAEDEGPRLAWTGMAAMKPREEGAETLRVLSPGLVRPSSRLSAFRARRAACDHDLTLELLEEHAADGPDLLMGLVLDGNPEETTRRIGAIGARLAEVRGTTPTTLEVRHAIPTESIAGGPRFGPRPWMRVTGPRSRRLPLRPRLDAIAPFVLGLLGVESGDPPALVSRGSGFRDDAMNEAGLPRPRRISVFQLKASEQELHREIGLSLLSRGGRAGAAPWIWSACQDQHGRLDPRLATLLMALAAPSERLRLLEEFRPRLGPIADAAEGWFDGESIVEPSSLSPLGPFVAGQLALDLRRTGRLNRDSTGS